MQTRKSKRGKVYNGTCSALTQGAFGRTGSNNFEGSDSDEYNLAVSKNKEHVSRRCKYKGMLVENPKSRCLKTVKTYVVPANCFPRYEYAIESTEDIYKRYKNCFRKHQNETIQNEKLSFHICQGVEEPCIPINDILLYNGSADDIDSICKGKSTIERLMQMNWTEKATSIIITGKGQNNLIKWGAKHALGVVVVVANRMEKRAASRRYSCCLKRKIIVTTLESASKDTCNFLERLALSKVKLACENIYNHLERELLKKESSTLSPEDNKTFVKEQFETNNAISSYRGGRKKLRGHIKTNPGDKRNRKAAHETILQGAHKLRKTALTNRRLSPRNNTRLCATKQLVSELNSTSAARHDTLNGTFQNVQMLFRPYITDEYYLKQADNSIKESLLEEMLALYKTSNVPRTEWPDVPAQRDRKVPKQVSEKIFGSCPTVKGVGYRFGTLQVVVEENAPKEGVSSIQRLLQQMKISKYIIETMSMKEYSSVGSEIYVDNRTTSGSLGCFATMTTRCETRSCVLLSKHVAVAGRGKEGRDGRVFAKDGNRLLGYVLQDTVPVRGYDIAAARLDVDVTTCDTAFKNSKGKAMKGFTKGKKGSLSGRKVHVWGAKSKPGKGIVTVPYYTMDGMEEHLIQVEDLHDEEKHISKRFVEPGDSGAIACMDDPEQAFVHPVSMNIGPMNYTEIEEDNKRAIKTKKGKYLTVPLSAGLEQLGTRTGNRFDLISG